MCPPPNENISFTPTTVSVDSLMRTLDNQRIIFPVVGNPLSPGELSPGEPQFPTIDALSRHLTPEWRVHFEQLCNNWIPPRTTVYSIDSYIAVDKVKEFARNVKARAPLVHVSYGGLGILEYHLVKEFLINVSQRSEEDTVEYCQMLLCCFFSNILMTDVSEELGMPAEIRVDTSFGFLVNNTSACKVLGKEIGFWIDQIHAQGFSTIVSVKGRLNGEYVRMQHGTEKDMEDFFTTLNFQD